MKCIAGACAAMAISTVGVLGSNLEAQAPSREITTIGCVRAWQPASADVTKHATNDRPGVAGVFLLTPLQWSPTTAADVPTYLLTPTQTVNFAQHLDDKVEVVGVAQTAPGAPTLQEIVTAPPRPENRPTVDDMPRMTVRTLRKIADSCP